MKGLIFSIKRYSVHDGPGIRVTFFMKGCPLSCWWCHNPEGISPEPETAEQKERVGEREFIVAKQAGNYYSAKEIIGIADKEKIFISESKGGITFSGGEPMLQPEFLLEALVLCKEAGYHTTVDTSGFSTAGNFYSILPYTDLFLFDLKHLNDEKHIFYTGVSNQLILSNLELIIGNGKKVWIRIPVIPGINDDSENILALRSFLTKINNGNLEKINLLPYHRIGASKYKKFNITDRMSGIETPTSARMKELKTYFEETGIKVKIGG